MIDEKLLQQQAADFGLCLSEEQTAAFDQYAQLLVDWNTRMNLTGITDPEGIVVRHFVDSLLLAKAVELPRGGSLIDVGTGAGFPGIPMKIYRPDLQVTLLDSTNKRIQFLTAVSEALGQENIHLHSRAEDGGQNPQLREQFDCATARAVAHMRELCEYCLPFVKVGGVFVALKGPDLTAELEESAKAIALLGGKLEQVLDFTLADGSRRSLAVLRKISQTPTKYPRPSAKMAKQPLK